MENEINQASLNLAVSMIALRNIAVESGKLSHYHIFMKNMNIYLALTVGDTGPVVNALRSGDVSDLDASVLGLLADHLEGKIKKTRGPSRKVSRNDRDLNIFLEFKKLDEAHGYDSAIDMLEERTAIGRKAIEKIITEHNKIFGILLKAHDLSALPPP